MVFIIIILLCILFIPLNFNIFLQNNSLSIELVFLHFIKIKIINDKKIINLESNKEDNSKKSYNRMNYYKLFKNILKFLNLSIKVIFEFGFQRRDITALLYGGMLSVLPIIDNYLKKNNIINSFTYNLYPNFESEIFNMKVITYLKTNMFNIILIIFILLKENIYVRKKYKNAQKEC